MIAWWEPIPRSEVRDVAEEVFDRPEFRRDKSLIDRLVDWLSDLFPEPRTGGGEFAAAGNLLLYLFLAALIALVAWLVVRIVRGRLPRSPRRERDEATIELTGSRPPVDWAAEAEAAESEGRWKEALACRYRELVAELLERGVVPDVAGRTTGELRADVAAQAPAAAASFSEATELFELAWYADLPTGPEENRRFRQLADRARLASAPGRVEEPALVGV
ncbi:MAG TPA: DUF4129 domain-containing protein [Microthrixaceae bacterium]|nr:DUF4129 domain-containing protein [Microthrixaceae bacterium]